LVQKSLPRLGSDHVPIRLELGNHLATPRPFRYERAWDTVEDFQATVEGWWNEMTPQDCGVFIFAKKMAGLKVRLRQWAKFSFGSIKLKKLSILHDLGNLDIVKESRCHTSLELKLAEDLEGKILKLAWGTFVSSRNFTGSKDPEPSGRGRGTKIQASSMQWRTVAKIEIPFQALTKLEGLSRVLKISANSSLPASNSNLALSGCHASRLTLTSFLEIVSGLFWTI